MNFNDLKNNALTKNQMREIKGGGLNGNGTCGAISPTGTRICNVSKSTALSAYAGGGNGARWCCDSCKNTQYCG